MKINEPEPLLAELALRAADLLEDYASLCELQAVEIMRDLHDTSS